MSDTLFVKDLGSHEAGLDFTEAIKEILQSCKAALSDSGLEKADISRVMQSVDRPASGGLAEANDYLDRINQAITNAFGEQYIVEMTIGIDA